MSTLIRRENVDITHRHDLYYNFFYPVSGDQLNGSSVILMDLVQKILNMTFM